MFKSYLRAFEIKNQKCQGGLASNICYWIESTTIHWARTTHTQTLFIWHVIHSWAKIIIRLHKTFRENYAPQFNQKVPKVSIFSWWWIFQKLYKLSFHCSRDLQIFANSRPSGSNFKKTFSIPRTFFFSK